MNGLNPNQCRTEYISLSAISVTEFYREFCTLLGLERVYYLYREKKQPLVLVGEPHLNHILKNKFVLCYR